MSDSLAELLDLGQDVGLAQDQEVLAVDLDLGAAVLGVQDLVALATSSGTRLPLSSSLPSPTARTLPFWGFSFAVSGRTMPEAVVSSSSTALTIRRSPRGLSFIEMTSTWRVCFGTRLSRVPTLRDDYTTRSADRQGVLGTLFTGVPSPAYGVQTCSTSARVRADEVRTHAHARVPQQHPASRSPPRAGSSRPSAARGTATPLPADDGAGHRRTSRFATASTAQRWARSRSGDERLGRARAAAVRRSPASPALTAVLMVARAGAARCRQFASRRRAPRRAGGGRPDRAVQAGRSAADGPTAVRAAPRRRCSPWPPRSCC